MASMSNNYKGRGGKGGKGRERPVDPDVKHYQSLMNSFPLSAQFVSESGAVLPDYPDASISVSLDILGNHLTKHLVLKAKFKLLAPCKSHVAEIDFYPGLKEKNHVVDFDFSRVGDKDGDEPSRSCGFMLGWKTSGGAGCGVTFRQDSLSTQALECLDFLEKFSADPHKHDDDIAGLSAVKIHVLTTDLDEQSTSKLETILQSLKSTTDAKEPWFAYLDERGRPNCEFNSMPSVDSIKDRLHGREWTQFPRKDFFVSPEEAHVRLGYGAKQEYEFDVKKLEQRKRDSREQQRSGHRDEQDDEEENKRLRDVSDAVVRRQLLALARLCDASTNPVGRRFWPVLLNRETNQLPSYDPTRYLGLEEDEIKQGMKNVKDAGNWTSEQVMAIDMARDLRGRLGLLRGPPGSGKTQVLVGITAFYLSVGISVILFTSSASVAENMTATLKSFLKDVRRPPNGDPLDVTPIGLYHSSPDFRRFGRRYRGRYGEEHNAELVISTTDNACIDSLFEEFGRCSKAIMIIHDDANMEVESDTWLTIFGLEGRAKVQGLVLAGDASEWHTDMHSRNSHMNAFAAQMSLSLFDRLVHRGFLVRTLKEQHRMLPQLSRLPILRQYKGRLINGPGTNSRMANLEFLNMYRSWLGVSASKAGIDLAVTIINVSNGQGTKMDRYASKRNYENVKIVLDLCVENYRKKGVDPGDIAILTPYRDQVSLYEKAIQIEQGAPRRVPKEAFPTPHTVNGFRGKESKIVILDLVLSNSTNKFEVGIAGDEYRSILGSTRARDVLIIVVNMSFQTGVLTNQTEINFLLRSQRARAFSSDDDAPQAKSSTLKQPTLMPYFNNYATILEGEGKVFEKVASDHEKYVKEFKGGKLRGEWGEHEAGAWGREDWQRVSAVSREEYANPQHEQDENGRTVDRFSGPF